MAKFELVTNHTDPYYEKAINDLIPLAVKEARASVNMLGLKTTKRSGTDGKFYNHCFFSEFFHREMKRLAIENGLRKF